MKYLVIIFIVMWSNISYSSNAFKIYLSPQGSDSDRGLTKSYPVETLARAQEILKTYDPNQEIEVHINQGTYYDQSVIWTYTNGHSITFKPTDTSKGRPVFDGGGSIATWFKLSKSNGSESSLKFRYIKVQNYNIAMSFEGNRNDFASWNSGNELYGMYFYRIGGKYTDFKYSPAAIRFANSRNNIVENSYFVDILNDSKTASYIHAIYFAHYSSDNKVVRNQFHTINGDPIRVRDESNYNYIAGNRFYSSGARAFYSDWYCNEDTRDCSKASGECPSIGNEFHYNDLYSGYDGIIEAFTYYGENNHCGVLPAPRIRASGNKLYYE